MNRIKSELTQNYSEGLILAQDLVAGRTTPQKFAKHYSELRRSELIEGKTGLFSPQFFEAELTQEIAEKKRTDEPLSLIMVDLDKLKKINDTLGHRAGDRAIISIAKAIIRVVRKADVPCRWGGDEFSILLPDTSSKGAVKLGERIRNELRKIQPLKVEKRVEVNVSIGITQLKKDDSPNSMFDRADKAVYLAKAKGGNTVEVL